MTLPFGLGTVPLPDWVPWWVPAVLLIPLLVYALLVLLVPFSTFGLRGRLEAIEARLDDVQHEIRSLALRLPAPLPEDLPPVRGRERIVRPEPDPRDGRARLIPPAAAPSRDAGPVRAEPRFGGRE